MNHETYVYADGMTIVDLMESIEHVVHDEGATSEEVADAAVRADALAALLREVAAALR